MRVSKVITAQVLTFSELSLKEMELIDAARQARGHAQAPYSHYFVGAAVRSARTGLIYVGCNVERATYTQTTHAEQAAIDTMVATEGPGTKIAMIATAGNPEGKEIIYATSTGENYRMCDLPVPCGQCLQIIWENCLGAPNVVILGLAGQGVITKTTIGDALPMRFGPEDLGVDYEEVTQ